MKQLKLLLTDTEAMDLLRTLKEKKQKHAKLYELAELRSKTKAGSKNAEKLMQKHTAAKTKADNLIKKIVEQL